MTSKEYVAKPELHLNRRRDRDVVGRPLPAACLFADADFRDPITQLRRDPDVVEAAALVDGGPVGRAVAPPRVELGRLRYEGPHGVDPASRALRRHELLAFDRRVR